MAYETPLGDLPVAQEELQRLDEALHTHQMELTQVVRDGEHSLEIQLPFLSMPGIRRSDSCR
jgi:AmmeMemoRadiSam system protein B